MAAAHALALVYSADLEQRNELVEPYHVGVRDLPPAKHSWLALQRTVRGFEVSHVDNTRVPADIPFVYAQMDAAYLDEFKSTYPLEDVIAGAPSEYSAMLRLGAWLGSRWDHGTDALAGSRQVCNPAAMIAAGEQGAKYWCEIAARTTVQAATSLGWVARVITGSRDGYTWEHAVAELWSNEFNKWFVLDTDFNVVYERSGVPLSAFELSLDGEALERNGELQVRAFAPPKPSLPQRDLIPFYAYVHVDLRTDWCTRDLRRGSPAGGDLATWWRARPSISRLLSARPRVDDPERFDWRVNQTAIHALDAQLTDDRKLTLRLALEGYSPVFAGFEISVDGEPWRTADKNGYELIVDPGQHLIRGRMMTESGYPGPASQVEFVWQPARRT